MTNDPVLLAQGGTGKISCDDFESESLRSSSLGRNGISL
jgi:hypothetical protein